MSNLQEKCKALRHLIERKELSFLMEAHNGLSARIVEEAGFEGIWASGLAMSASQAVRDSNELSWTQVLDALSFMNNHVRIPILVDGDTGHGNFNNFQLFVRGLEQRGIAGVCIEDKRFPKTNSFVEDKSSELAPIDEFCGKIRAGKASHGCKDFVVVARVEALLLGLPMSEALKRAHAYADAGADAILIHSKKSTASEVLEFKSAWKDRAPVVIVPTAYFNEPSATYRECGISTVIWANHLIRGATAAMQTIAKSIREQASTVHLESEIASVKEIFRLQRMDELKAAEDLYLA